MAYNLEKMISVKALERIIFVMDEIRAFAEIKDLPEEIYLPDKKSTDMFSQDDYQGIISLLYNEKILNEEEMFHREHMPIEQYSFFKINYKKFDKFYEEVANRINTLKSNDENKDNLVDEDITGVSFDEESGILKIGKYSVNIDLKDSKTISNELLSFLKKDFTKEADYFEIAKYIDYTDDADITKYNKDKYYLKIYRTCKDIQEKIKDQTEHRIKDFLVFNCKQRGSVKINEKYLRPQS